MYQSLDRRRHQQKTPSALELLEQSKKLYVQTEFLKSHRIDPNGPRLFRTESEEELNEVYQNSLRLPAEFQIASHHSPPRLRDQTNATVFCLTKPLTARKSAFQPVQRTPPRPPKNNQIQKRQIELASCSRWELPHKSLIQSLPSYEEFMKQGHSTENKRQKENRPIPPPRRSLLNAQFDKEQKKVPPVAMPRRRQTTTYFGDLTQSTYIGESDSKRLRSQATSTTNLAKSTPDLSLELLVHNIPSESTQFPTEAQQKSSHDIFVRPLRSHSQLVQKPPRPPTNSTRIKRSVSNNVSRQSSSSFPSPDSSKDSGVCTPEMNALQITSDTDFEERIQRWERRKTLTNPISTLCPIVENKAAKNEVQELFDSQGLDPRSLNELRATFSADEAHDDSDMISDFTSITAERKQIEKQDRDERETTPKCSLVAEKPVSAFERNARVLRWIHGCSAATSTNC